MSYMLVFDIDGVLRDVSGSYRRAISDTVEQFTQGFRPNLDDIDALKGEGVWNNDWEASQELIYRYFENRGRSRNQVNVDYDALVAYFQDRYRGGVPDQPDQWKGYITHEPLLVTPDYFASLSQAKIAWGFFSGATRGSALFALERRLALSDPILVAMEDAPGKPDPRGLFAVVEKLTDRDQLSIDKPVAYVGDTVADMHTIMAAQRQKPERRWVGIGVLPPHVAKQGGTYVNDYAQSLKAAGAETIVQHTVDLTPAFLQTLMG